MKSTVVIFATFWLIYVVRPGLAQTVTPRWGLETELIQPFLPGVGIYRLQLTRTLTHPTRPNRGDLLLGAYIRPHVKHDIVEKINEYLLMAGYRQYLWKGLHVEAKSNIGLARGTNNRIDGNDYNKLSWFGEANVGYRFSLAGRGRTGLYVLPQVGVLSSISSNIGPRGGKSDTFPQGSLLIGVQF